MVNKIFSRCLHISLADMFFKGAELSDYEVMKGKRHGACREGAEIDSSCMASERADVVTMGNQPTARDRVNAAYGTLQRYSASG